MSRVHKVTLKISAEERQELNELVIQHKFSLSDCIRIALRDFYSLSGFQPSYEIIADKQYSKKRKWELY